MTTASSFLPGPHPEEQALREEIARLRASLTALLLQKDELLLIQCRRIETAYLRRFGALELKLHEAWCACLRAKKKAKLIRAAQNRRERADLRQIDGALDEALADYRQRLEDQFQRVAGVLDKHEGPGLSSRGAKELRTLYRQVVKALHPDLHPGEDEANARKLQQAMRAYRAGDLNTLRSLCDSLDAVPEDTADDLESLRQEAARLRAGIQTFDREIEAIKTAYPYYTIVYLEDEAQGVAHEQELREKLQTLRERTARYEAAIEAMLAAQREEGEGP